jgi:CRP-like cAMP-binding protein
MMAVRGQKIFGEGETGREMYMLLSGEIEVSQGGQRLGFLSDGAYFGEFPLLCALSRGV